MSFVLIQGYVQNFTMEELTKGENLSEAQLEVIKGV